MNFIDRSSSTIACVIECLKQIDAIIKSNGFSEFSRKFEDSIGSLAFLKPTDPSLKLLWILIGGDLDEGSNTVFRYLEPDSTEFESCNLSSLSIGNINAAGDATFLRRYVSAYSMLLDIALAKVEGNPLDPTDKELQLIRQFIDDPRELVLLGEYNTSTDSFSHSNQIPPQGQVEPRRTGPLFPGELTLRLLIPVVQAQIENDLINAGVISEKKSHSYEDRPKRIVLRRSDFEQFVFKVCFYENIMRNIYQNGATDDYRSSPSSVETANHQVDLSSISSDILDDTTAGNIPQFVPSPAVIPAGLQYVQEGVDGLKFCLANSNVAVQSFFNHLPITGHDGNEIYLNDDSMLVTPFDESLYCQIVIENHRYALAELYDQREEEAVARGERFKKWGKIGIIFTLNPLLPFLAYNLGKASTQRGSRLEELIPDPKLEFQKDRNSFLAMTQASGVLPRLRRLIFHKIDGPNGVYYRIIPAVITNDSVIPCQVFSFNSTCFLRPVSAGIDADQSNYNARRIHRQYCHPRLGGASSDTGERILIRGKDIDDQRFKIFQFSSDTRDLAYFYVDYQADPSHVF